MIETSRKVESGEGKSADRPAAVHIDQAISPCDRFDAWREAVSAVFDLEVEDPTAFDCGMTSWKLGPLVLGGFWSSGNAFVRDRRKIAASGLDHYVVQTLTRGASVVREGGAEGDWPVGSVRMLDMTRPIRTQAEAFSNLTLIVPRAILEPLLGAPDDLHGVTLAPDSLGAGLLRRLMADLAGRADAMTAAEAEALGPGVAAMVASCFGPSVAAIEGAQTAHPVVTLKTVQSHILKNLTRPDLSADSLCSDFGLSRATLYRLFEPLGGVEAHIRAWRLDEAWRRLTATGAGYHLRVGTLVRDLSFANQASFSRDFRHRFGVSPSEARDGRLDPPGPATGSAGATFLGWVRG